MSSAKPFNKVTVFGAGGTNIGHHLVKALLSRPGIFTVSIIARKSSKSTFASEAKVHYIEDELPHERLVEVLRGQDVLVSAIGFGAIQLETKLIDAAIEAKVRRFLPSEYGVNNTYQAARDLCPVFDAKGAIVDLLKEKELEGLTWTSIPTGLWLDWALNPDIAFANINLRTHTASVWAKGDHKLSWTTLPWAAEGIVQIILAGEVSANKVVPIRAFEASQNEIIQILESVQKVKYRVTNIDPDSVIPESQKIWREEKKGPAALTLVKAGFFLGGYGSNLVDEGIVPTGNEYLTLSPLSVQDIVREATRLWG
ncbi:hypothetical protein PV10_08979 [Exophiala mesophila]|uniref:NmrA-like domain-containing protein n=1 Tax=Exophiala mesophila TaxID=212818 RepID=A0A0D1Z2D4_EXOME|nr:uncharacterized protein PV10_08979 [Exophiala mesophila]KIV88049.1 hypothetical protein PV10_08979 [Exophiala mesophila]